MTTLISARATKIEVVNNITEAKEIKIDVIHEFHVSYATDEEHCRATLHAGIKMEGHPEILTVLGTITGDYSVHKISSDEDKKKIHVECYYNLFPYAQALVTRLCADAGLPPFYLQPIEMKEESVIVNG